MGIKHQEFTSCERVLSWRQTYHIETHPITLSRQSMYDTISKQLMICDRWDSIPTSHDAKDDRKTFVYLFQVKKRRKSIHKSTLFHH